MSRKNQFAGASVGKKVDHGSTRRRSSARVAWTLLLIVGGAGMGPSSGLLAAPEAPGGSPQSAHEPTLRAAAVADIPFSTPYDSAAEAMLLDLANQERSKVGAPPLKFDSGLTQAARVHAEAMVSAHELSHQVAGESPLPQRLAVATRTQLDQEGENVAFDRDAEDGHKHLMLSPPHRANLLNAAYNAIGIGVVRAGDRLYIVQDFAHALPSYSEADVKDRIASAVAQSRHRARRPDLARQDLPGVDAAACSMAKADKLGSGPVQQLAHVYTVLRYTTLSPETLPANSIHAVTNRDLRGFSIGSCYARTPSYPMGVYWVVLAMK